jgi:S1-C subfamily serine protease
MFVHPQFDPIALSIGPLSIRRPLDVERALLGHATGDRVPVLVSRNGEDLELDLLIASRSTRVTPTPERTATPRIDSEFQNATWDAFGMTLEPAAKGTLRERGLPLDGGMRVVAVRPGSSADQQRVAPGDILIQIHRWYTTSEQDVRYVLSRRDQLANLGTVRFDIIRGTERFYGQMALQGGDGSVRR